MKALTKLLAALLAFVVGVQPVAAQVQSIRVEAPKVQSVPVHIGGAVGAPAGLQTLSLQSLPLGSSPSALPTVSTLKPSAKTQTSVQGPAVSVGFVAPSAVVQASALRTAPAESAGVRTFTEAPAQTPKSFLEKNVQPIAQEVEEAGKGLEKAPEDGASAAAEKQFDLLTGEQTRQTPAASDPVPAQDAALSGKTEAGLQPASQAQASEKAEVPPAKTRIGQVFKDPERNKSFWRYVAATIVYYFGIEMYIVGLPFVVSSYTKNVLRDNNDARFRDAELLKAAIRENRSIARIAHWVSQAFSYASTPLFTRGAESNPKKWLVRSAFIRAGILALIPTAFFLSGVMSLSAALLTLFALIGVQSFFQGLFVTMDMGASTKLMGDKSVTPGERMKANSILTFIAASTAIIGPAFAGQIAQIKELFGKMEVGGALIYGVYALATGIAGLLYATVGIIGGKLRKEKNAAEQAAQTPAKPSLSFKGVIQELFVSLKDGVKIIVKNRFLRTMTLLTLVYSLFSDPLIFNVLPEYVEGVLMANTGAVNAIMGIPVIGWLFKGMMSTPMGYFSMLMVSSSIGSILGTLLLNPMRKLFSKLGFKTEEALSIPFFLLAALEIPLFWIMISAPSMWAILGLYGLQTLVTSFGTMITGGLHQKTLGGMPDGSVNKVLAAESFLGILAAILSTYLYGFVLGDIPIKTALLIAAGAATVYGALRAAAPWLFFTKAERSPPKDAPNIQNP